MQGSLFEIYSDYRGKPRIKLWPRKDGRPLNVKAGKRYHLVFQKKLAQGFILNESGLLNSVTATVTQF